MTRSLPGRTTLLFGLIALLSCGCASSHRHPSPAATQQIGESMVFMGDEPATLAHRPDPQSFQLRSTYEINTATLRYEPGRDYVLDPQAGTIRRTPGSRLPDFRTNILYGIEDFDHSKFPGFGNGGFFAFADYRFIPDASWPRVTVTARQRDALRRTLDRIARRESLKVVAYGDSITAGGDATRPGWIFWQRWADSLRAQGVPVEALNGATGGDSTVQGLQRLQAKVIDQRPDLVLIGFGMNDHNRGGVPVPQFKTNLHTMIRLIRAQVGAEVLLFSAFPPNPRWHFGQGRMAEYAAATEQVATEASVPFADVYGNWQALAARKKCEDLLGNNINHPNDFGHWIYFRVLESTIKELQRLPDTSPSR